MKKLLLTLGTVAAVAAPVAAVVACSSDKTDDKNFGSIDDKGVVSVTINVEENDFQSHIGGEAARVVADIIKNSPKKLADITEISLTITDGTVKITNSSKISDQTASSSDPAKAILQKINHALSAVSALDATSDALGHDMAMTAPDYETKMVARINAVKGGTDFNFANKLLEATGNPTRFASATQIDLALGGERKFNQPTVKEEFEAMVTQSFSTLPDSVKNALEAQIAKITD